MRPAPRSIVVLEQGSERHLFRRLQPVLLVVHRRRCGLDHMESIRVARLVARVAFRLVQDGAVDQDERTYVQGR